MNYPMMMPIPYPMPSRSGGGYKRSYNNSYRLRKLYKKNKKMGTRLKNLNKFKKHILSLNPPGEEPTTIGADGNVKVILVVFFLVIMMDSMTIPSRSI